VIVAATGGALVLWLTAIVAPLHGRQTIAVSSASSR
jgi:hypothetical protein